MLLEGAGKLGYWRRSFPAITWSRGEAWNRGGVGLLTLVVFLVSIVALAPVILTVVNSFRTSLPGEPATWGTSGWIAAFSSPSVWRAIGNTFILSFMRVPIAVVLGCIFAWLLIRTNVAGRRSIELLFWIAFFLPTLPTAMAWILLIDPQSGWLNVAARNWLGVQTPVFNAYSYLGITWVHLTASTVPIMIILLGPAFRTLDPSMEESARMCGASTFESFTRVVVPLISPALLVATIATLIRSLEAFEVELLLGIPAGIRVYATKIQELAIYEPPQYAPAMALSVPFVGLLFVLALVYQRFLRARNFATVSGKSKALPVFDLGRWRPLATALCWVSAGIAAFVPTLALLLGSFMEIFGVTSADGSFSFTTEHWHAVLHDHVFLSSLLNTLELALLTAALSVLIFSLIAYLIVRTNIRGRNLLDLAVWLPWAFPGILLSLTMLWAYLGTPVLNLMYGSLAGLVLAMLFKEMPIAVNLMKSGLLNISSELEEAGKSAGANWWQIYYRILLPLLSPTAVTVAILAFIGCVRDISTVILLSTPQTRPLSILLLDYSSNGSIEKGAVVGVIMAGMAAGMALLGRKMGMRVGKD
jgi:iron(III) transport system permease protein